LEVLREVGLATYAALLLWLLVTTVLWRRAGIRTSRMQDRCKVAGLAA
jgi:hypothetical protein